jgi:hypothetical protein
MRLVVLELGVGIESMMEKRSGEEEIGGDSVWGTRRGCSTTKSDRFEAAQQSSETNEGIIYRAPFS